MSKGEGQLLFSCRTRLVTGRAETVVIQELNPQGTTFVVTDPGIAATPFFSSVVTAVRNHTPTVVFDRVEANPSALTMERALAEAKAARSRTVVAIGGGSVMDVAKAVAIGLTNPGTVLQWVGEYRFALAPQKVVAVPTTAGTGSETSWHISVNDTEQRKKVTIRHYLAAPEVGVIDARILATTPRPIASQTFADAFAHAFESFISNVGEVEMSQIFGGKSLQLMVRSVQEYIAARSLDAAERMGWAAALAGIALSHARTGVVHQMARPLGAVFGLGHGQAVGLLLPRVLRLLASRPLASELQAKVQGACAAMGLPDVGALARWMDQRQREFGMPRTIEDVGVGAAEFRAAVHQLAIDSLQGQDAITNPLHIPVEQVERLYEELLSP